MSKNKDFNEQLKRDITYEQKYHNNIFIKRNQTTF